MENRITGHTKLYCLIGSPVGHSGSPAMYNYSFARTGVDGAYLAFDVPLDQVGKAIEAIKTFQVKGFNITMPDKTAVMDYLDEISPAARMIGACNTVVVSEEGKLIGYNTDGRGFTDNLRAHGVEVKGKKLLILGTGGAANAISIQTALEGAAEITIFNRRDEFFASGQKIVEKLAGEVPAGPGKGGPAKLAMDLAASAPACPAESAFRERLRAALMEDIAPIADIRATAEYRRRIAFRMVLHNVAELWRCFE